MWFLGRGRRANEEALADARAANKQLIERLTTLESERDALRRDLEDAATRADENQSEAEDLRTAVAYMRDETANLRAEAEELRRRPEPSATPPDPPVSYAPSASPAPADAARTTDDRGWDLVLADLARRWAAGVGAPPDARGVRAEGVPAQVTEAISREVERLREEVGVDVSLKLGDEIDPTAPVLFLLAAVDLVRAMAGTCERVAVELDGELVLVGEVFADIGDELAQSRTRAIAAGVVVDPLDVTEEQVRVVVRG